MREKIRPCPCCGGEGKLMRCTTSHFPLVAVVCCNPKCAIRTKDVPEIDIAIKRWNKRYNGDEIIKAAEREENIDG